MLFPSAEYDVRQAARCLAMKCDTAAVLHLMRVLETGLGSLAFTSRFLSSTEIGKTSSQILKKPSRLSATDLTSLPTGRAGKSTFLRRSKGIQYSNAWRNHPMHSREKYTYSEAKGIFLHVSGLMAVTWSGWNQRTRYRP